MLSVKVKNVILLCALCIAGASAYANLAAASAQGTQGAGFKLANEHVQVVFDGMGCVSSIREVASGRELILEKVPFMEVKKLDGTTLKPVSCISDGEGVVRFVFSEGECKVAITPFDGGWSFQTVSMSVKDCGILTLGRVVPVCNKEKGSMSNIVMDDQSAVVLRGYMPEIDMMAGSGSSEIALNDGETFVLVRRKFGFTGMRYGLSAGPSAKILKMLRGMARAAGMVQTGCGGPWSLDSEVNRGAYIFGTWMDYDSADDWIRLLDKAGCQMFHLHAWWLHRGSYEVNPYCFPNGLADMKKLVDRLHAAGKRVSTHSLSAVVQFGDKHISPEWFDDFAVDASYTLSRPYKRGDTELWVNEKPKASVHSKVLTGITNGNILRLGNDLLQYDDFTEVPPYKFTGVHVAREPYGEKQTYDPSQALGAEFASAEGGTGLRRTLSCDEYQAGRRVDYLHHRYAEFVAKPGSRLAEVLTDRLAEVFNTLELDGIYFDGSEAMNSRYAIDWIRERTIAKLKARNGTIVNSASCRNPFNWWNRSLAGTWDHPTFHPRGFNDRHIRVYNENCRADFLRVDLGWWNTHAGSEKSRGYFPEEQDYVGCKTAANDFTISLQGPRPTDGPLAFAADQQLTIFGKWERARYARAFKSDLLARMKTPGEDWRFRQNEKGEWVVSRLECPKRRVASGDFAEWEVPMRTGGRAAIRVEALYAAKKDVKPVRVLDASHLPKLERTCQKGVEFEAVAGEDPRHGATIRLKAKNNSAKANAAWAGIGMSFPEKRPAVFDAVSSLWVKGDGSGATLNVQLHEYSVSENYVKLDFTGWRKIDLFLRERDAELVESFDWPYESARRLNNPRLFMCPMDGKKVRAAWFWINGVPEGATANVEIAAWDSYPQFRATLKGACVVLNGNRLEVPFDLVSGEFAELENGSWTHFSEKGEPIERVRASAEAFVRKGVNRVSYASSASDGAFGRAEVTIFREEGEELAFSDLTPEQKNLMRVEYEMPVLINPKKGLLGEVDVRVRPGEKADVRFEILGPAVNPCVNGRKMAVVLNDEYDRVASYDGVTWQAIRIKPGKCGPDNRTVPAKRTVIAEGRFDEPFKAISAGTARFTVSADETAGARATFFKEYR